MTATEDREKLGLALCPFCGGAARFGKCVPGEQEGENDGAEYVECCDCGASTCLVFPLMDSAKQVLRDMWNRRKGMHVELQIGLALLQRAMSAETEAALLRAALDAETARWEEALRLTWQMVDPVKPAGQPGSYTRGQDSGIVAALTTLRANLKPPNAKLNGGPPGPSV